MAGPEDKVKKALKLALDAHPDRIDHFTVMTRGMGSSGVADRVGTVKFWLPIYVLVEQILPAPDHELDRPIGVAFRIECKGKNGGKPTALQERSLVANAKLGGFSAVCRPGVQTIYHSDATVTEMSMLPRELVEYMLSGEWVR